MISHHLNSVSHPSKHISDRIELIVSFPTFSKTIAERQKPFKCILEKMSKSQIHNLKMLVTQLILNHQNLQFTELQAITCSCKLKQSRFGIPRQVTMQFRYTKHPFQIILYKSSKFIVFPLNSFFPRKSHSSSLTLVLCSLSEPSKNTYIQFNNINILNQIISVISYSWAKQELLAHQCQQNQIQKRLSVQKEQVFFTVADNIDDGEDSFSLKQYRDQVNDNKLTTMQETEQIQEDTIQINNYQHNGQVLEDINFSIPQYEHDKTKTAKDHFLWIDWKRLNQGGLVCINIDQINQQKRVFKHILTQFGSNLLKHKSIMNISLPVQIFKKQSALKSIARNFSFAPALIEPILHKSKLQKMKAIVLLQITMGALALSMQKPFNPILGETFQGSLGGFQISLQQISHHPPISSLFFSGKGYQIIGNVSPIVSLGFNCARGYSSSPITIQFLIDSSSISFTLPKMVIGGMLLGERTFNFQGINYAYQCYQNGGGLIAEIEYGPRKHFLFKTHNDPYDYISGSIFEVSPKFMEKFLKSGQALSPKSDHTNKTLSSFCGSWCSVIYFDSIAMFDIASALPLDLIEETANVLPSDSRYRTDISKLIHGNVQESQAEKQNLEELQRKDKKLREKLKKFK